MSETPGGQRRTTAGHVNSYGEGRVCASPGCETRLSRYNARPLCAEHGVRERAEAADLPPGGR